ncbi:RIP metalloprotease RseP [Chitinophaga sp. XS-30]|uniref:RIP metalloprotease RseP n=1 Tax=Chitinophaga sp. XS-30 TaxID=2604421 RepID=UPI0011DC94DC|nr:RIP metalloprotease RseP [Chitinophaga sp. XS-30]QEH41195.1 RIP metalloprotease RseP [Chitinophaga sp. XS-30]
MTTQEILVKAGQLILSLSILVVLHELGHFIPAKLFKTKVEKFYLFFDPWFSLFKFKKGDTEYGVGWLPLGGYVKISGMIDESMDREQMNKPAEPWEFRSKPAWQRLIIMIGGVTVNLILGFLIYTMILWHYGEEYLPAQNVKYGIVTDSLARTIGLQDGDMLVAVAGKPVENFEAFAGRLILKEAKTIQVVRDGQQVDIQIPKGFPRQVIKRKGMFVVPRLLPVLDTVPDNSFGFRAGFREGDRIIRVNGDPVSYNHEFYNAVKRDTGKTMVVDVLRNGTDTVTISTVVPSKGFGGIGPILSNQLEIVKKTYTFGQAIPAGFNKAITTLVSYVQQLRLIFVSEEVKASESLGGFMSIGNLFPGVWDWQSFWALTALLSIILAFMNILPIPALDGGHVIFLTYEMITGRKPSEKFMEYAQIVGMVILFGLLLFANGLDVWRWITSKF